MKIINRPTKALTIFISLCITIVLAFCLPFLTRVSAQVNDLLAGEKPALIAVESVTPVINSASVLYRNAQAITWVTANFEEYDFVNLNLLRKISEEPQTYELVRIIAQNTANDGQEVWTPEFNEVIKGLYIEVTCGDWMRYSPQECKTVGAPMKIE